MQVLKYGLFLFVFVFVVGCVGSGYEKTYQTLLVSQQTAISIAQSAKTLHAEGVIDDIQLSRVKGAYERAQKAQGLLIDAQKAAIDLEGTEGQQRVVMLQTVFIRTMSEFVNLAIEIGLIGQGDERITGTYVPKPIPIPQRL